jgi:hypothetical protein
MKLYSFAEIYLPAGNFIQPGLQMIATGRSGYTCLQAGSSASIALRFTLAISF